MKRVYYIISSTVTDDIIDQINQDNQDNSVTLIAIVNNDDTHYHDNIHVRVQYVINPFAINNMWFSIMYHYTHHIDKTWNTATTQSNIDREFIDILHRSCASFIKRIICTYCTPSVSISKYSTLYDIFKDFPDLLNCKYHYSCANNIDIYRYSDWRTFMILFCDYLNNMRLCYNFISHEL